MKKIAISLATLALCIWLLPVSVGAAESLIPVGQVVGLELRNGTVTVAALEETTDSAAKAAGVQVGDVLLAVDGKEVTCGEDVRRALAQSKGSVTLTLRRQGEERTVRLAPRITEDGPKLGLFLRQGVTGIGTVTWYDPEEKTFGTLGHGVNDGTGSLVRITGGEAYRARVIAVKKGKTGAPGQLMGTVEDLTPIGALRTNTEQGVFGISEQGWQGKALTLGEGAEVKTGQATILSTVSGNTVREYSVEILKIYPKSRQTGRNMLIRITDPALLEATGGIVQGMSGSPIIQNGKLIGAVTHVLVNDPTMGYGIFIENMLDAA